MLTVVTAGLLLIALTTLVHYEVLRGLTAILPRVAIPPRNKLLVVIFAEFIAHGIEVGLYGVALFVLVNHLGVGALTGPGEVSLLNCICFSAETFSSLGFGDVVPVGSIRLLAGVEALIGLLLIGWSASYAYIAMGRFWSGAADR
jgi:hypothetical protein